MELPQVKILKCKVCNKDIPVNANYPITTVTCIPCKTKSHIHKDTPPDPQTGHRHG